MIQSVVQDITKSKVDALIELFEIDATDPSIGAGVLMRICNTNQTDGSSVFWQGLEYQPFPIQITGVEMLGQGAAANPILAVGNVTGIFSVLCVTYKDMLGAKVTRRRVLRKYLDGQSGANPLAGMTEDVWYLEQKTAETRIQVTWTLTNALDLDLVMIPRMRVNCNFCQVPFYRGPECSYTDTSIMTDKYGNTLHPTNDRGLYDSGNSYAAGDFFYVLYSNVRFYYVCTAPAAPLTPLNNVSYFTPDVCTRQLKTGCVPRFNINLGLPILAFPGTINLPT